MTLDLDSLHPETQVFLLPLERGGKGGGDNELESNIFLFSSPSPHPSPARGGGVSG